MTIEFKRAGDVMVFTCPGFKIEVAPNGAERIELNRETINSSSDFIERITEAFKVLDLMIEHKDKHNGNKKVTEMNFKVNVDTEDAEEAMRKLNIKASIPEIYAQRNHRREGI